MPAAAVIPAPVAYIKVVAVKKLVVGSRARRPSGPAGILGTVRPRCTCRRCPKAGGPALNQPRPASLVAASALNWVASGTRPFYFEKIRVFKAGCSGLNNGAWNNGIGSRFYFVGFRNSR